MINTINKVIALWEDWYNGVLNDDETIIELASLLKSATTAEQFIIWSMISVITKNNV